MERVRTALLRLAHEDPTLRSTLVGLTKQADKWQSLPKGWTQESVEKFWESLTGENKHKVTKCIKDMEGKVDDPGAFCASLADKVMGPEWRSKKAGFPPELFLFEDAIEKMIRFYPNWVLDSAAALFRNPTSRDWRTDLVKASHGLMMSVAAVQTLRSRNQALDNSVPQLDRVMQASKALAYRVDEAVQKLLDGESGALQPVQRAVLNYYKAVEPLYKVTGLTRKASSMNHEQAMRKLQQEFDDWPKGDLEDAVNTTSPRPSLGVAKVQNRYWELRGGRPGPLPGEWKGRRWAMRMENIMASALPPVLKRVLAEVRVPAKRKYSVNLSNSFSMYSAGDDGAKGFTALVDIDTNQYSVTWGAFGGGALGQKPSPVDDVNTPKKTLPDHLVVVQGQIGGRDPYASFTMTDKAFARLSGGGRQANGDMLEYLLDHPREGKTAALIDHLGAYAKVVDLVLREMKSYMQGHPFSKDPKPLATGFIYSLFQALQDRTIAQALWNLFEHGGPSLDPQWAADLASQLRSRLGSGAHAKVIAAAIGMSLLNRTRQPRLAERYDTLMSKLLGNALAEVGAPQGGKAMTPSQTFEAAIDAEIQGLVQTALAKIGKDPAAAETLAFEVAEDVNWHSLQALAMQPGVSYDRSLVSHISQKIGWSLDMAALFAVALLRVVGLKQKAEAVKREALAEFPDAFADLGPARVAARYLKAMYSSLAGAAEVTGDDRYGKGQTEVWYVKTKAARDLMMGSKFLLGHGGTLPDPQNLDATHVFLGRVDENNPGQVFHMMQGEMWSPEGQARPLVARIGHTSMMVGDIMVIGGKTLMVDHYGFFDLNKQSKVAFNKFNAPELVSQLLAVLEQEGLKDALNQIKMKKVPELVEKAWASRGKTASSLRVALNLLQVLSELFQGVQPYVRDWRRFLQALVADLDQWPDTWGDGLKPASVTSGRTTTYEWTGEQIGGYGYKGNRGFDPPEYQEASVEVAETVGLDLVCELNLRTFPKALYNNLRPLVTDARGFIQALSDLRENRNALMMLGKVLGSHLQSYVEADPVVAAEVAYDDILETAKDMGDFGWDVRYGLKNMTVSKVQHRITSTGLSVQIEGEVTVEVEGVESPEPDYDPPDRDDYDSRWEP